MALVPIRRKERNRGPLAQLHEEMDELFDSFFRGLDRPFFGYKAWPAVDIAETENEFIVKAEVPGCKAEDIDISVQSNTLTISGEKREETEKKDKGYYHVERSYGSFRRDLNLPSDIDTSKIEAECKDGILTVTLPKTETAKPVKVKIKGQ